MRFQIRAVTAASAAIAVAAGLSGTGAAAEPSKPPAACDGKPVTIVGTAADDTIRGTSGGDVIDAGAGDDVVFGLAGDDTICGAEGVDRLVGGPGDDYLESAALDGPGDVFVGGPGDDEMVGNAGGEVDYRDAAHAVSVDLTTGDEAADGSATGEGSDTLYGIGRVIGSQYADRLVGDYSANWFTGLGGADVITTGLGGDTVYPDSRPDLPVPSDRAADVVRTAGKAGVVLYTVVTSQGGADRILGGDGFDHVYGEFDEGAVIRLGGESDYLSASGDFEADGGPDRDVLFDVGTGRSRLHGGSGDDSILGGRWMFGDAGDDSLRALQKHDEPGDPGATESADGGAGVDTFELANERPLGWDTVDISVRPRSVTYRADRGARSAIHLAAVETLSFVQFQRTAGPAVTLTGSTGSDLFVRVKSRSFTADLGAGDDRVEWQAGRFTVDGGDGRDRLIGLDVPDPVGGSVTAGADDDFVFVGAGDDRVEGGPGDDEIYTGAGDDTIIGGFGADLGVGGTGRDRCDTERTKLCEA